MLSIDINRFADALQREMPAMPRQTAISRASALINETDSRLEENVLQWIEGKPISDLWVGKYSINAILELRRSRDFLDALDAINLYLRDPKAGEARIWRARR